MNWDKSRDEKDVTRSAMMIKGDNGWTVVDILDHEAVDFQWPTYDYLWMIDENNDKFLSRDQGETFTKLGTLGWIWLQTRMKIWSFFNGIKFRN